MSKQGWAEQTEHRNTTIPGELPWEGTTPGGDYSGVDNTLEWCKTGAKQGRFISYLLA